MVRAGFLPEDLEVLLPQFTHRHPGEPLNLLNRAGFHTESSLPLGI